MMKRRKRRQTSKLKSFLKWFLIVIAVLFVIGLFVPSNKNDDLLISETHPTQYSNLVIKDAINGSRTEKIGEYSILTVNSASVNEAYLTDWYFNYVCVNDFNWCMILYNDYPDFYGVYATKGIIQKNVRFQQNEYGDYMLASPSSTNETILYAENNGKLVIIQ